ncbi:MAG: gliding motility-associated C-terminal domain-containing protein [Saprospiraceae bacterium]
MWTGTGIVSGNQSNTPVVDAPGWYVYFVENNLNGCTSVDSVQVGIDTIAPVISIAQAATLTCSVPVITLAGSVQLPQGSYQVGWTSNTGNILSGADGLNPDVDQAADYLMTVVNDQNGCSATVSVSVPQDTVSPIAQAQVLDTLDCIITNLSIDGSASSSGMNYVWMAGPGGQIVSGSTSTNPVISAPGEYTLLVTNPVNGCTEQTSVTVNEDVQTPVIAILNPDTLNCLVDTLDLNSSVSGSGLQFDVQWATSNGNLIAGSMSFTPTVDQPGVYILTATDLQNGCTATEQVEVPQDIVAPLADAGESYVLHCNQMEVNLDGSGQGSGVLSYNWTTHDGQIVQGASSLNPVVAAAGNYALVVTNETNGCTATDFVIITEVLPPVFDVTLLQPNCMDPLGMLQIDPGFSGQQPFTYSIDGGATAQADPAFAGLSPGNYTVVMTDDYGCTSSENILINEVFEPELILPDWIAIEFGDSTLLQPFTNIPAGQVASWSWTPSEGLSCTDCERPWAKPYRNIQYTLEVSDLNGCTATAQVVVGVSKNRKVYAPNIFSPNDDGFNDRFMIFGKAVQEIKLLEVYDRWGTKLFVGEHLEPNNENQGWDGTYRGEQLNPAVFAWLAIVVFDDGEEVVLAGDVTLYR